MGCTAPQAFGQTAWALKSSSKLRPVRRVPATGTWPSPWRSVARCASRRAASTPGSVGRCRPMRVGCGARRAHRRAVHQGAPALWEPADPRRPAGGGRAHQSQARCAPDAPGRPARPTAQAVPRDDHERARSADRAQPPLAQTFVAEAPNQRWVSDTTEFQLGTSGKLYLAAILDLSSRFVVGWP
jgi:transposase InsO family protein